MVLFVDDVTNLILSGSVLVIALAVLAFAALTFFNASSHTVQLIYITEPAQFTANASIGVSLGLSIYMHTQLVLTVKGNNTDFGININRQGIPYGVPIAASNSTSTITSVTTNASMPLGSIANASIPNVLYSIDNYYVLVTRLYPNSDYVVDIKGSSAPVCAPGRICPYFIIGINSTYNVTTGPNGSITNISVSIP